MPSKIYTNWNRSYEPNQELCIIEPTDMLSPNQRKIPVENKESVVLSNPSVLNPFERLRPLDIQNESNSPEEKSLENETSKLVRPLKSSIEKMQHDFDDNNDSSTSTTNRSIHLPVEKQRGLSEIIRKRNSRYKVEDYKRSFQKCNTFDEEQSEYHRPLTTSKSDYVLSNHQVLSPKQIKRLNKTKSFEIPIEFEHEKSEEQISTEYVIYIKI
jgi:hypothetical protein